MVSLCLVGCLPHNDISPETVQLPDISTFFFVPSADQSYDFVLEPSPVALPLVEPLQTRVVQVACGRAHSLVLTDQEGGKRLTPAAPA